MRHCFFTIKTFRFAEVIECNDKNVDRFETYFPFILIERTSLTNPEE